MSNPTCWAQLSFCVTFLSLTGCFSLLCVHRSPITTLHQPPSQPLWWDSLWRPLSPTTMPKSPLEPPRSPACRLACDEGLLFKFSTATREKRVNILSLFTWFPQLLQQLPAERVEQKEIPAEHMVLKSTFDSLVQRCQLAARDPVSLPMCVCGFMWQRAWTDWCKRGHRFDFIGYEMTTYVSFSANKKETWWCSQTFGIPVWQTEGAVGKKLLHITHYILVHKVIMLQKILLDKIPSG